MDNLRNPHDRVELPEKLPFLLLNNTMPTCTTQLKNSSKKALNWRETIAVNPATFIVLHYQNPAGFIRWSFHSLYSIVLSINIYQLVVSVVHIDSTVGYHINQVVINKNPGIFLVMCWSSNEKKKVVQIRGAYAIFHFCTEKVREIPHD